MWRSLLGLLTFALISLWPQTVSADTSVDVTITATGIVVEAPGGLILTYVTDYQVDVDWTKSAGAEMTMVRAAVGRPPADRTQGYLIYYGNGTAASDTGVSLDETGAAIFYRAWSETLVGEWSPGYAENSIQGVGMTLIAEQLVSLVQFLLVAAIVAWAVLKRDPVLYIIAGLTVLLYSYGLIEPDVAGNPLVRAAPVMGIGLYMIIKAGLSAATSSRHTEE